MDFFLFYCRYVDHTVIYDTINLWSQIMDNRLCCLRGNVEGSRSRMVYRYHRAHNLKFHATIIWLKYDFQFNGIITLNKNSIWKNKYKMIIKRLWSLHHWTYLQWKTTFNMKWNSYLNQTTFNWLKLEYRFK